MKPFILRLALALSLLFNVFFAAGYVSTQRKLERAETPDEVEVVSSELGLTGPQQSHFDALRQEFGAERESHREAMAVLRQLEAQELAVDAPDQQKLDDIRSQRSEMQRAHRAAAHRFFDEFMNTLTPEQRRRIGDRMRRGTDRDRARGRDDRGRNGERNGRRRGDRGPSRNEVMKRFDVNGDGRLDDSEEAAFREATAAWEQEHRRRQAKWEATKERLERMALEKFDADGDGLLDDDERKLAWNWKREQLCEERRGNGRLPRSEGRGGRGGPPPPGRPGRPNGQPDQQPDAANATDA